MEASNLYLCSRIGSSETSRERANLNSEGTQHWNNVDSTSWGCVPAGPWLWYGCMNWRSDYCYFKCSNTLTTYHTYPKTWLYSADIAQNGLISVSAGLDLMPHSVASDPGLHCLLRHICPNIYGKYCIMSPATVERVVKFIKESFLKVSSILRGSWSRSYLKYCDTTGPVW